MRMKVTAGKQVKMWYRGRRAILQYTRQFMFAMGRMCQTNHGLDRERSDLVPRGHLNCGQVNNVR